MRQPGVWVYDCIAPANVLKPTLSGCPWFHSANGKYYHHPETFPFSDASGLLEESHKYFSTGGGGLLAVLYNETN
jgi:hypothetical protein